MGTWINFKELREQVKVTNVMQFYGIELEEKNPGQHQGFCPLPTHRSKAKGPKSPSFSVNLEKGIWQCFGCQASGNILDLVCRLEGMNPADSASIRKAALFIQERFVSDQSESTEAQQVNKPPDGRPQKPSSGAKRPRISSEDLPVLINQPLDFALKNLDASHPHISECGFEAATAKHFGIGVCERGLLKGRLAIPIFDSAARLVGYAGRVLDDHAISNENPEYLFPSKRERDGKILEFGQSLLVYNIHSIDEPVERLMVVQWFPSVWWLWQNGYPETVALMGGACSADQAKLIASRVSQNGVVYIMSNGGAGGSSFAAGALTQLASKRSCRWIRVENGEPTVLTPGELAEMLE